MKSNKKKPHPQKAQLTMPRPSFPHIKHPENWRKVSVNIHTSGEHDDFVRGSWWLAVSLWGRTGKPLYFARYTTDNHHVMRVEIAVELKWSENQFQRFFDSCVGGPKHVKVVGVEKCEPSLSHIQAWMLASTLVGKEDMQTFDTLHWFFNMIGCNYLDEIRMLTGHAAAIAANLSGSIKAKSAPL